MSRVVDIRAGSKSMPCSSPFFPHLIAGPIVRWDELAPQLEDSRRYRINWTNISLGLTIFLFCLAKKIVIADQLSEFVAPVFDAAAPGRNRDTRRRLGRSIRLLMPALF